MIDPMEAILVILALASPLLTAARLWQIKSWRLDRLKEYLKHEGGIRAMIGTIRPIIVIGALLSGMVFLDQPIIASALISLVVLSALQIALKKQPFPIFTKKTLILIALALAINGALINWLGIWSIILVITQPFVLYLAWLIFHPVDTYMKNGIMEQAAKLRGELSDLTVIGITGSAGKTTTKELLAHLLSPLNPAVTPAYLNADIGVGRFLIENLNQDNPPQLLIVEMGAYRQGEIAALCKAAQPDVGVLTGISNQHLGLFGSQDILQQAKGELLQAIPESGRVFLNADSELANATSFLSKAPVTKVGTADRVNVEATNIKETADGLTFDLDGTTFSTTLQGTHNVTNVLLAIAVARHLGVDDEEIKLRLSDFEPPTGTFSVKNEHGYTVLDDTHNLSPASFKAALRWAKAQPYDYVTLVTPGVIELGPQTEDVHIDLGNEANGIIDRFICLNKERAAMFDKGYEKEVELYDKNAPALTKDHLILLLGRIPDSVLKKLLP